MLRQQKEHVVQSVAQQMSAAKATIVTEYRGLNVDQMTELRDKIREAQGSYRVVKNRLAKRALSEAPQDGVEELLVGPTGIATADADPVELAKALVDFAKDFEAFVIKGGNVEGKAIDTAGLEALAKLPSREALLSMLLSVMSAPARDMASVLAAVPRGLVTALKAIADTKE